MAVKARFVRNAQIGPSFWLQFLTVCAKGLGGLKRIRIYNILTIANIRYAFAAILNS